MRCARCRADCCGRRPIVRLAPSFHALEQAERKKVEAKFKELGDALDVLTDPLKRRLWDEGHDLESIAQRVQMAAQQQGRN